MKKVFLIFFIFVYSISFSFSLIDESINDIKTLNFDVGTAVWLVPSFLLDRNVKEIGLLEYNSGIFKFINGLDEKDFLILSAALSSVCLFDDPYISYTILESAFVTSLVTYSLKVSIGRGRPNSYDSPFIFKPFSFSNKNFSFPSGHSSFAWAIFTPLAERYSKALYVIPTLFSVSRVIGNYHWVSDVVFGSYIGYVIGKSFYKNK